MSMMARGCHKAVRYKDDDQERQAAGVQGDGGDQQKISSSTMDLLFVYKQLLHVLDEIGPTLLALKQDIQQNVEMIALEAISIFPGCFSQDTA